MLTLLKRHAPYLRHISTVPIMETSINSRESVLWHLPSNSRGLQEIMFQICCCRIGNNLHEFPLRHPVCDAIFHLFRREIGKFLTIFPFVSRTPACTHTNAQLGGKTWSWGRPHCCHAIKVVLSRAGRDIAPDFPVVSLLKVFSPENVHGPASFCRQRRNEH